MFQHGVPRSTSPKACSRCGGPRNRGAHLAYCRDCHNEYARAHRPKHQELSDERRRKVNCCRYTNMLVQRGQLVKTPCGCGARDVTAQHHDWTNPRNVTWVCKACRAGVRPAVAA